MVKNNLLRSSGLQNGAISVYKWNLFSSKIKIRIFEYFSIIKFQLQEKCHIFAMFNYVLL